ncbi:MAG: hypothetical protein ACM3Q1_05920 [Bacteroidales bacterium]
MPEWLNGILGTAGDVIKSKYQSQSDVAYAQALGATVAQQRAYAAELAQSQQIMDASQTQKFMVYGVGLLLFLLALRQTAQAR